jgi:hypothetical protein
MASPSNFNMMNNQAFYDGGDNGGDNIMMDEQKFKESLNTGPRGGTPIRNLKSMGGPTHPSGGGQSFQYNPNIPPGSSPGGPQGGGGQQYNPNMPPQYNPNIPPGQPGPPPGDPQGGGGQQYNPNIPPQYNTNIPPSQQRQPSQYSQHPQHQQFDDNASRASNGSVCSQNSRGSHSSNRSKRSNKKSLSPMNMKKLGNIINNKLKENNDYSAHSDTITASSEFDDNESEHETNNKKPNGDSYLEYVRDSILIIVVYVILSQDFLKRAISSYIPQINSEGIVGNTIYAIIHAVLYIIFKMVIKF